MNMRVTIYVTFKKKIEHLHYTPKIAFPISTVTIPSHILMSHGRDVWTILNNQLGNASLFIVVLYLF